MNSASTGVRQTLDFVQPEPKFAVQVPKAIFVISPAAVKIDRAVQSLLDHSPPPSGRVHIAVHVKWALIIWGDSVHTALALPAFFQVCAVPSI